MLKRRKGFLKHLRKKVRKEARRLQLTVRNNKKNIGGGSNRGKSYQWRIQLKLIYPGCLCAQIILLSCIKLNIAS